MNWLQLNLYRLQLVVVRRVLPVTARRQEHEQADQKDFRVSPNQREFNALRRNLTLGSGPPELLSLRSLVGLF